MLTRKTYGERISAGSAVILVKEPGLGDGNHPFWNWLLDEGVHLWHNHGNYGCDWVFINLNSMICAPGMPGIKVVSAIREHAITSDEFRTIWGIFMKYEGLPVLKMPEKTEAKLLLADQDGTVTVDEVTQSDLDQFLLKGKIPLKENNIRTRIVNEWKKNPRWREYYETAPSERCRRMIVLELMYNVYGSKEVADELDELADELNLEEWLHMDKYCTSAPVKKYIRQKIRKLSGG